MTIALFTVPTPSQALLFYKYNNNSYPTLSHPSSSSKLFIPLCSPSTSTSAIEEGTYPPPDELPVPNQSQYATIQSGCKACGKEEIERGCNGEGRVQGGIATVPGFGWWPIKAYRPCPAFVASGGRYRRQGQSMDEVVSGRGRASSPSLGTANNSSKDGRSEEI